MYILILVFAYIGTPPVALVNDPTTNSAMIYPTLIECTTASKIWKSAAANPTKTVKSTTCYKIPIVQVEMP